MYKVTLFMKVVKLIPRHLFSDLKVQFRMDKRVRKLKTWDQFLLHLYSALTNKSSIRPLLDSFNHIQNQFYHMNLKSSVSRSTFSDANQNRDSLFFKELFSQIYQLYRPQLNSKVKGKIDKQINLIDSTLFPLSEKRSAWAFLNRKGNNRYQQGFRVHCVFDANRSTPRDVIIDRGNVNDIRIARRLTYNANEYYVGDRAYFCFKWFNQIQKAEAFFVTRKKEFQYVVVSEGNTDDANIVSDQIVKAVGKKSKVHFDGLLRLVTYYDKKKKKELTFISNIMEEPASFICELYKTRWDIEVFFREMKHYMKLRTFMGTSKNAIAIQLYSYAIAYILLRVFWTVNSLEISWYRFLEVLRTFANTPFEFTEKGLHGGVLKCNKNQFQIGFKT